MDLYLFQILEKFTNEKSINKFGINSVHKFFNQFLIQGMDMKISLGAIATLNTRVTFQYVATNADPKTGEYVVWAYDLSVQSPVSI
jgi:hypothetical protein